MPHARRSFIASTLVAVAALCVATHASAQDRVVLYTAADEGVAAPLIAEFEERAGISVDVVYDTASALVDRVRGERAGADVIWLTEPFGMIRLAQAGALAPLDSREASARPEQYIGSDSLWHGFGVRARGLAINAADSPGVPQDEFSPDQWQFRHASAPQFSYGMFVVAEPETSLVTAGHYGSLYTLWGEYEFQKWCFQNRRQQMRVLPDDAEVVRAIGMREALGGPANSDEALAAQRKGWPVEFIPVRNDIIDLQNRQVLATGPIVIPNAVGVVKTAPNATGAEALANFLLSADAERMLAEGDMRATPVRQEVARDFPDLVVEDAVKFDYEEAAGNIEKAVAIFRRAFPH